MGLFKFLDLSHHPTTEHAVSFKLTKSPLSCRRPTICNEMPRLVPAYVPLEVAILIMEAAYYDDELAVDKNVLRACSLVCRDWATPAQQLLFSQIELSTQSACLSFLTATSRSTDHGVMLADSVLRMRMVLDHNQPYGMTSESFALAIVQCPNLYELNLSLYGSGAPGQDIIGSPDLQRMRRVAPSFEDSILEVLKSGPSITALQFTNWSDNRHSLLQLLDVWPNLKSLSISGNAPELRSPSSEPFPCALHELHMNFQTSPSSTFLKWLLHNSADTLRILGFAREPPADVVDYLINTHSETLESVILPTCSSAHARLLQKCQNLREFVVENVSATGSGVRGLSPHIEHLAFGLDKDLTMLPVLEVVKTRRCLNTVTVHVWNGGQYHPQLASLQIACACRGIDLRMTHDIAVFRTMIRGDPITHSSYPRSRTLKNHHVMRA